MVLDFAWLPPEINSARIFAGAGSGPLHVAASAWESLAQDLSASATSFESVVTGLTSGPWSGPASASMAAAASPYVGWLFAAAAQAASAGAQARAAATAFEVALAATVHPLAVTSNRTTLATLVATNFLGQNTPAIFATEFEYVEMWAQDVGAMLGYHSGATAVASTLAPFSVPPLSLAGLGSWIGQLGSQVVTELGSWGAQIAALVAPVTSQVQAGLATIPGMLSSVQPAVASLPIAQVAQVAQVGATPAGMAASPLTGLAQIGGAGPGTAGLANAPTGGIAGEGPRFVGQVNALKGLGAGGAMGAGMNAEFGTARLVGAMSVPPGWQGSTPARAIGAAMSGLGRSGAMNPAGMAAAVDGAPAAGSMPMPTPAGGSAAEQQQSGTSGRGGTNPHVVQKRPTVVPRRRDG